MKYFAGRVVGFAIGADKNDQHIEIVADIDKSDLGSLSGKPKGVVNLDPQVNRAYLSRTYGFIHYAADLDGT